ncbi:2-polyprenyl-3-methyl-6-methoxy-1,4-benzoquinone monooxygenase [Legionella jordanis]|uniref:3-demethoxyubiquinol 3-hydroxylase n=1 Tax=Legionella jordanis TaxID=456 RepID=A0A0W0VCU1_9GAMM|nr:2-polyprenyl-3-methyl-6-methoxy-1,4-benzoquinone monooxygenase [Legionella jordanis]KTD17923.1 ubiquinone biosynthesis protein COQ7 [Legionella jordanis]RMX02377.1 2-polyprenyl-3-methyl-6-methoxy-1,4-benzoquinone monooxygenase [Legionella jordanis]RMX15749.1 2-polyprenyl-3-methyl-6-methoxy-1,4-benzoquinone monooxygenase [Legionella jordanis]VEH13986.1 ubiquinone biosynthesis protein COQ7 [Legionella jordanis]
MRKSSLFEQVLAEIDGALRTLLPPNPRISKRLTPGNAVADVKLGVDEQSHVAGLMRVNHAGEVCAQALYRGQALTAKLPEVREQMANAAEEEVDHLAWCEQRLQELGSQPSVLNPLWYMGSLMLGIAAGVAGDRWSLGFLAETELQVSKHLQSHLERLPPKDNKTKVVLEHMHEDEAHHADMAIKAGAAELPPFIKQLMQWASKIMTRTSYYF